MPTLDREQEMIVRQFKREARQRGYRGRKRRKFVNSSIATGLVETDLHELNYGDADSRNWRQEREQGYGDDWARTGGPLNTRASVDRYASEFEQFYSPDLTAGEISARIQRPREDLRGKYQQRIGEANAIRKAVRLHGGPAPRRRGGASGLEAGSGFQPGALAELLQAPAPKESLVPGGALTAPAHSAQAVMPEGYAPAPSGGGPSPRPRLSEQLEAMGLSEDFSPAAAGPGRRELRRQARERLGMGGLRNAEKLGDEIESWAREELGIKGGSRDRTAAGNAAVGGAADSDHLEEPGRFAGREGVDLPTTPADGGWAKYRATVRKLGLKPNAGGFTEGQIKVGDRRFKVQVIFGDAHGHGDHIHVGFRRVR
jgi:hypothetical protein